MISIRLITGDDWQQWRRLRRAALREAPYAFGSTLAQWSGTGDTEIRWRDRLNAVPTNLVADLDLVPVAIVSLTEVQNHEAEIISMWVAPTARGLGVADALIQAALGHARSAGADRVALDVTASNERAIRFYARTGFIDIGWVTNPDNTAPERRMCFQFAPSNWPPE